MLVETFGEHLNTYLLLFVFEDNNILKQFCRKLESFELKFLFFPYYTFFFAYSKSIDSF